ncbi:hypothetical protein [Nonomuraea sp. GTA35]
MFRRVLRYFLILTAVTTAVAADGSATGHSAPWPVAWQGRA